jgi:outer membrane lipoprotein-sorting protein
MSDMPDRHGDDGDLLARSVAALRGLEVPEGPTDAAIARALGAVHAASAGRRDRRIPRRQIMFTLAKVAAAAAVAAGLYVAGGPHAARAGVEFAEVAARLRDAKAVAFRLSVTVAGRDGTVVSRVITDGAGLSRTEQLEPAGPITIFDARAGRGLSLDPAAKTALAITTQVPKSYGLDAAKHDFVGSLRTLVDKRGTPIGREEIDGRAAEKFRVQDGLVETLVWADPETKAPVRVEMTVPSASRAVLTDFDLDPPIDATTFSLEPPAGYRVESLATKIGTPEEEIAWLLRSYAEVRGGAFPERFDDWAEYGKALHAADGAEPDRARVLRLAQAAAMASAFSANLKDGYGYRPEGVMLGDADKLLFWYRPNDKETYRGLYGDLHSEDLPADRVPER